MEDDLDAVADQESADTDASTSSARAEAARTAAAWVQEVKGPTSTEDAPREDVPPRDEPSADVAHGGDAPPLPEETPGADDADEEEEQPAAVPDHARVVAVPLANPTTAPELLTLARALVRPDAGRVIGVVIVLGDADAEQNIQRVEALQGVVDGVVDVDDDEVDVELLTRPAVSIARGILDVALDEGVDMILLGVQAPTPGDVAIGGVAESVIDAAHCDVLVYRRGRLGSGLEELTGIVAAVDGSEASRTATRLGIILGEGLQQEVQVMHIRRPGETIDQAELAVQRSLHEVVGADGCRHTILNAMSPVKGLKGAVSPRQLAVVGFENKLRADGRHMGVTSVAAMDTLRGPVLAVSRPARTSGPTAGLRRLMTRLRPRLTDVEEEGLVWQARLQASLTADFVIMCVLSGIIATLGLLLDSAAVIIGAMLVAPLMSPLIAFGTTLVDGDTATLRRAVGSVLIGSGLVAGTALVIGLVIGPEVPTTEMAKRGSPSLIDAGVAIASGMAGAYASARKGIPAALAGVAIAAALVPPIGVFGLALATDLRLAAGSGLLFATNITCIAVSAAVALWWLGLRVDHATTGSRRAYIRMTVLVLLTVLGALVVFGFTTRPVDQLAVQRLVVEALGEDIEVVDVDERGPHGSITVTIRAEEVPEEDVVRRLARRVADEHDGVTLRLAVQPLLTIDDADLNGS